jgi:hypothetical protein
MGGCRARTVGTSRPERIDGWSSPFNGSIRKPTSRTTFVDSPSIPKIRLQLLCEEEGEEREVDLADTECLPRRGKRGSQRLHVHASREERELLWLEGGLLAV